MTLLSAVQLNDLIDRLLAARERTLPRRSFNDILATIDAVVTRFLDSSSPESQEAEARLPEETGLSPAMIHHTLPLLFQEYRGGFLASLLREELGDSHMLDRFTPTLTGARRAYGMPLVVHVLAGNIPGAGLDGVIFSLLVKSAVLVKTASSAPLLPMLFARTLAEVDQELADCLAITHWPGGNTAMEEIAFSRADMVIASGADNSLAAIRQRAHGQFIGYGHKASFSVISQAALTADAWDLAQRAAYDVALFDQQGCLSPQLIYVEAGGTVSPKDFAALLAQALAHWQQELPRGQLPPEASLAIRRARDEAEWQVVAGKDVILHASPHGAEWTVIYEADPMFLPSPLFRTVRVKPLQSFAQLIELLNPVCPFLEAAGIAVAPEQRDQVAALLGRLGVSRICPLGAMQLPPLSWRHGGRPRVADLVRWVELEK